MGHTLLYVSVREQYARKRSTEPAAGQPKIRLLISIKFGSIYLMFETIKLSLCARPVLGGARVQLRPLAENSMRTTRLVFSEKRNEGKTVCVSSASVQTNGLKENLLK